MAKKITRENLFRKVYYVPFEKILKAHKNYHVRALVYIIRYTGHTNEFAKSKKEIARAIGCSLNTVDRILDEFIACNLMHEIPESKRFMINPECYVSGDYALFCALVSKYEAIVKSTSAPKK